MICLFDTKQKMAVGRNTTKKEEDIILLFMMVVTLVSGWQTILENQAWEKLHIYLEVIY